MEAPLRGRFNPANSRIAEPIYDKRPIPKLHMSPSQRKFLTVRSVPPRTNLITRMQGEPRTLFAMLALHFNLKTHLWHN